MLAAGAAAPRHREGGVSMLYTLRRSVVRFLNDESGPTAVEYAVMLALIIVVCLAAISFLGNVTSTTFSSAGSTLPS
jgi:pilus assembly protein Flp/PilA